MMSPLTFTIDVNATSLVVHLEQLPMALRTNLRATIIRLTDELLARVRAAEPRRTGRLQSETRSFIDENDNRILGRVRVLGAGGGGPNIAAAALEYGAHRSFQVRGYQRRGVTVSAYRRRQNIAPRRFLHAPAEAMRGRIMAELQAAIDKTLQQQQP